MLKSRSRASNEISSARQSCPSYRRTFSLRRDTKRWCTSEGAAAWLRDSGVSTRPSSNMYRHIRTRHKGCRVQFGKLYWSQSQYSDPTRDLLNCTVGACVLHVCEYVRSIDSMNKEQLDNTCIRNMDKKEKKKSIRFDSPCRIAYLYNKHQFSFHRINARHWMHLFWAPSGVSNCHKEIFFSSLQTNL